MKGFVSELLENSRLVKKQAKGSESRSPLLHNVSDVTLALSFMFCLCVQIRDLGNPIWNFWNVLPEFERFGSVPGWRDEIILAQHLNLKTVTMFHSSV